MPSRTTVALTLSTLAVLSLLTGPAAAAGPDGPQESAVGGFVITFVVLLVGATVFALVWRAVSRKRERR